MLFRTTLATLFFRGALGAVAWGKTPLYEVHGAPTPKPEVQILIEHRRVIHPPRRPARRVKQVVKRVVYVQRIVYLKRTLRSTPPVRTAGGVR